jgi:YegS/Rv2252/BmrU family lipid kinase
LKVRAILNPRAGLAARQARAVVERGQPAFRELSLVETEGPGHARELAREAVGEGHELLLAVGGDGTVNEVAEGMLGSEATLGLVPVGSGNGLARALRIPLEPRAALEALASAVVRRLDVGLAGGRVFLNVAGAGFDAAIGAAFHRHGAEGGRRGVLTYVRLGLAHVGYRAQDWRLAGGLAEWSGRALVVVFANGPQYGGGAWIAPRARLDDGRLEVVVIEDGPRLGMLLAVPRLFLGSIERYGRYHTFPASAVTLEGPEGYDYHRDGEPERGSGRLEICLRPRALRILVPRGTAEDPAGPFQASGGAAPA